MNCNPLYYKNITLEQALTGGYFKIQLQNGHKVKVVLKPGVYSGKIIRLKNSEPHENGKLNDIYIELNVMDHPLYHIEGLNVKAPLIVTSAEAKMGATKQLIGPDGKLISLEVLPDSENGHEIIIKNAGLSDKYNKGDIVYQLKVINWIDEELIDLKNVGNTSMLN